METENRNERDRQDYRDGVVDGLRQALRYIQDIEARKEINLKLLSLLDDKGRING